MARPLRIDVRDGWYHVTARGTERRSIFTDPNEHGHFLELLEEWVERFGLVLHAYVLMPNHYHLLTQTPQANLSRSMQWLQTSYSIWFNRRHRRVGPLFQGRFKAFILEPAEGAWPVSRYIHLNPIRVARLGLDRRGRDREAKGIVAPDRDMLRQRRKELREYRWNSYAAYAGRRKQPHWLRVQDILKIGGARTQREGQRAYRAYVEEGLVQASGESPWERVEAGIVYGSRDFVACTKNLLQGNRREQPALRRAEDRPDFQCWVSAVVKVKGEEWEAFRDRHGDPGRDMVLYLARRYGGLSLAELGASVGGMDYAAVATATRRMRQRLRSDSALRRLHQRALKMANVKT